MRGIFSPVGIVLVLFSALQVCCYDCELFGVASFEDHCAVVYDELKAFCAQNSLQLHMLALTRQLLGFAKSSEFPAGRLVDKYKHVLFASPKTCFFAAYILPSFHSKNRIWGIGSKAMTQYHFYNFLKRCSQRSVQIWLWLTMKRKHCFIRFLWPWRQQTTSCEPCTMLLFGSLSQRGVLWLSQAITLSRRSRNVLRFVTGTISLGSSINQRSICLEKCFTR